MADSGEVTKNGRTLVLCFDGTSSQYDGDVGILEAPFCVTTDYLWVQNTNVVKFFALLKKDDFNEQLCYYQVRSSYCRLDLL
jgi:uncharacterized protein (DUF2235 family)